MEKVRNLWAKADWVTLIFVLIGFRIVGFGGNVAETVAISTICVCLMLYKAFSRWLDSVKIQTLNETTAKDLAEMKDYISRITIKNTVKPSVQEADRPPVRFF